MNQYRLSIVLIVALLTLLAACGGEEPPSPTATPEAVITAIKDYGPTNRPLILSLTSPEINLVTNARQVTVSGVTVPDATLSVNGHLALPDPQGRFSLRLDRPQPENPMAIEVIATSITGESESQVRPVIFSDQPGVFGTVSAVTPSDITLQTVPGQTASGSVTLDLGDSTTVSIHGWESPTPSNLAPGTSVAVLTDGSRAVSVLAIPSRPVATRHFTGLVLDSGGADSGSGRTLTLRDGAGRKITAMLLDGLTPAPVGEIVTAVLEQNLTDGSLTVTALDRAISAAERLSSALELQPDSDDSEASAATTGLRWRLAEHGVRNLSMLVNTQPDDGDTEAMANAKETYGELFAQHRIGVPSADVTGLVASIDREPGLISVQPESGPEVTVKVTDTTPVVLSGERIRSGQLDLASRVAVRYAISSGDASRITVLGGNTLPDDSSTRLALSAGRGEVQGTLMEVGPRAAIITVLDQATGQQIAFQATGSTVIRDGAPAELEPDMVGFNVFARFDPDSYRLLELESISPLRDEELVSGAVHSFIPKIANGNLTIRTPDGQLRSLTHDADTVIRREGRQVSINEVRLGDLVRPNTRVRSPETSPPQASEIVTLNLKAPEPGLVNGIIRGVDNGPDGDVWVTVSDIWLDLISLKIGADTPITQDGRSLAVEDLAVGQEISNGDYDPVTLVAGQIRLDPPRVAITASAGR